MGNKESLQSLRCPVPIAAAGQGRFEKMYLQGNHRGKQNRKNVPLTENKAPSMENFGKNGKTFLLYGLMLLAFGLLLYYYHEVYQYFFQGWHFFSNKERVNKFVISFGSYAPLVFIGLQILQVLLAPIPGEFTSFVGGYVFGNIPGLIYSTVGLSLGSLFAFLIARGVGMPFVRRFMGRELMGKFEYLAERHGAFFTFILFLIPGIPKDSLCYLLGLSPMHVFTFLVISSIGRIPGTLLLTMQGNSVRSEHYRASFIFLGLILLIIVLTFIFRDRIEKLLKRKKS
jgi:uncharacterized membrane protein YdjX (TVP38/TMEM64 family)